MSFDYHEKAAQKLTPFANFQIVFQKILDKNAHGNPQPRHPQIHSNFLILQLHSFHAFQKKYHSIPQHDQANRLLFDKKILNLKNKKKHPFENPHFLLCYSTCHCILLAFLYVGTDSHVSHHSHLRQEKRDLYVHVSV